MCDTIFWEKSFLRWIFLKRLGNAYRSVIAKLQKFTNYNYIFISHYTRSCFLKGRIRSDIQETVIYLSGELPIEFKHRKFRNLDQYKSMSDDKFKIEMKKIFPEFVENNIQVFDCIAQNKDMEFYESNNLTKDHAILMKYFYSDRLDHKVYLKNLNLYQIFKTFLYPVLLLRKIIKSLKN